MTPAIHRLYGVVSIVVVAAAVVWGFVIVGSPEHRRIEKLDERRLDDLQAIAAEMVDLVVNDEQPRSLKRSLFESLDALEDAAVWRKLSIVDPETGEPYAYRVLDDRRFELCATFDTVRRGDFEVFWDHPAGRHCFVIDVLDPP